MISIDQFIISAMMIAIGCIAVACVIMTLKIKDIESEIEELQNTAHGFEEYKSEIKTNIQKAERISSNITNMLSTGGVIGKHARKEEK